jgi:formylglycine-generating enzyme required for sulfatase activity
VGLAATCGADENADCCQAAMVPGGTFYRSYDTAADIEFPNKGYPATVSPFVLDTYEVTVGRFRMFVNAGMGTRERPPASGSGAHPELEADSGWDTSWNVKLASDTATLSQNLTLGAHCSEHTWTATPGANENKPLNCVTWYEALAFCIWDGGYLPTEAEWSYAAGGGDQHRAYPWSDPDPPSPTNIDCMHANYHLGFPSGMHCVNGSVGGTNHVGSESPAGDGRWGHSDLAGNVWEWLLDWHADPYLLPCIDCARLTMALHGREVRGGGYGNPAKDLRVAGRGQHPPASRNNSFGLRCARAL